MTIDVLMVKIRCFIYKNFHKGVYIGIFLDFIEDEFA